MSEGALRRVLVVDDDPTVAEVVTGYLERDGYAVSTAQDGIEALRLVDEWAPHLVVLDLMLPGIDGIEVCRRLRNGGSGTSGAEVAVVMLTALGEEDDRVAGLEVGADDYLAKPFSPRELVLRVESVLRRVAAPGSDPDIAAAVRPPPGVAGVVRAGRLEVDLDAHVVTRDGRELALTVREYDLLAFLLRHHGRVFSREDLMQRVWGWSYGDRSTVTVHIRRLREKIEDDPADPRLVVTVWGVGYRLDLPPSSVEPVEQAGQAGPETP